jgi:hypothetical protein
MIPHHQNAVNMAKTLLKLGNLQCDDLLDEESSDCIMTNMMRDTINSQNHQIQMMRGILDALNLPPTDDCVVTVTSSSASSNATGTVASTSAATSPLNGVSKGVALWTASCLTWLLTAAATW